MTSATLEQPIAILYTGATATWCKGGCGKFRYPYCLVDEKPYCETCAIIAGVKAIPAPPPAPAPEKVEVFRQREFKPRKRVKEFILEALSSGPASSKDLAERLKLSSNTISTTTRRLVNEGIISVGRVNGGGNRGHLWYSLPEDFEKLRSRLFSSLYEKILIHLSKPKSFVELQKLLINPQTERSYYPDSIKKTLRQLIREEKVMQIYTGFKMYGAVTKFKKLDKAVLKDGVSTHIF